MIDISSFSSNIQRKNSKNKNSCRKEKVKKVSKKFQQKLSARKQKFKKSSREKERKSSAGNPPNFRSEKTKSNEVASITPPNNPPTPPPPPPPPPARSTSISQLEKTSGICASLNVNEEEFKKILEKLRKHKNQEKSKLEEPTDLKSQIALDRVKKNKKSIICQVDEQSKRATSIRNTIRSIEEKTIPEKIDNLKQNLTVCRNDSTYDYFPKIDEIENIPDANIFDDETGNPKWMKIIEPTEQELDGVDPAISVGSEHIEMYHERRIILRSFPEEKNFLDQWQCLEHLKKKDEHFFMPDLVFSNTIRSLINVAGKIEKRIESNEDEKEDPKKEFSSEKSGEMIEGKTQEEAIDLITFPLSETKHFYSYLRVDPMRTVKRQEI